MNDGRDLIAIERERQKTEEGWSADHDDEHVDGELAQAANCYRELGNGSFGIDSPEYDQSDAEAPDGWPWDNEWWKPKTRLRNLVRAGALYQAEIDRLCRERSRAAEEIDALMAIAKNTQP